MIQQGQVFKLKTKGADGQPLWAYRYRLEGRGSERPQPVATGSYGGASDDRSTVAAFSRKRRSRDAGCSSPWRSSTPRVCSHTRQRRMEHGA